MTAPLEAYGFQSNGLGILLNEIAKNSADHTEEDAMFGMEARPSEDHWRDSRSCFGDFGIGIKRHIEQNLAPEDAKRLTHMSLAEAYRLALKPGYTSSSVGGLNTGHGMSIIIDCANDLGLHLSVFDASSRGLRTISIESKILRILLFVVFFTASATMSAFFILASCY